MLKPSSAELDAGWALRPMRVDRGRVYPSKALLGSARSSSLDSNIQLVFNNARLGAAAAVELSKLAQ